MPTGSKYSNPSGINFEGSESLIGRCSQEKIVFRFSSTNRAYLKKSSRARLFTRLISNQMRRLPYKAPRAIRKTRKQKAAAVGRNVFGPKSAMQRRISAMTV